jgi:hypothetical protein
MINYYEELGVTENATIDEIKHAYRLKVAKVHPDVNPSVNAHEEFIALNQAYEYLIKVKTGQVFNSQQNKYAEAKPNYTDDDLFNDSRKRAAENAKIKYEEFIHSEYYKSELAINAVIDYFFLFLILFVYLLFFGGLIVLLGVFGVILTGFFSLLFVPLFIHAYGNIHKLSANEFLSVMYRIVVNENVHILLLTVVNLIAFFKYGFVTFLPFKLIVALYLFPPALVYAIFKRRRSNINSEISPGKGKIKRPYLLIWGILPMIFSLFLFINFNFRSAPRVESYKYEPATGENSGSVCELEGGKYHQFGGIRFVFSNEDFYKSKRITYTIAKGCLGIDVLTDFTFETPTTIPNELLDTLKNLEKSRNH